MPSEYFLADAFLDRLPDDEGVDDGGPPAHAETLRNLQLRLLVALTEARRAHPGIDVNDRAFCRHLGQQVDAPDRDDPLAGLRVSEAFLAFAGGQGDPAAVQKIRAEYGPDVDRILRRAASTGLDPDELAQRAWVKLLAAGPDGTPHILKYGGRGSLQGWIRVVTSRMAVDLLRSKGVQPREQAVAPEVLAEIGRVDPDPQFAMLRERYQAEVQAAMEQAFADLSPKDRRLLRWHLVERLSIDDLGAMFGVHRTTASRWLHKAKDRLGEGARAALRAKVGVGDETVDSLIQMVRSQIDLSVARLLASQHGAEG